MSFIKDPNLPQSFIKSAVVGNYPEIIDALRQLGTEVIMLDENRSLSEPVRKHADMSCLSLGGGRFLTYDNALAEKLSLAGADVIIPKAAQSSDYPHDIGVNCLIIGKYIICNTTYCVPELREYAESNDLKLLNVRQGYARCSVAVIDERSVITADKGIAERMSGEGFDVLLIRPGFIELPGYDCGFIGGCCGKMSKDRILFSGSLRSHPDGAAITEFVTSRGVEIITASDGILYDFGGFIAVEE